LESLSVQTNITPLNPASVPSEPSKPRLLLNLLVSIFLGTLLGVGAALRVEVMDRGVRAVGDIVEAIETPVLAVMSGPSRNKLSSRLPKLPSPETSSYSNRATSRNP